MHLSLNNFHISTPLCRETEKAAHWFSPWSREKEVCRPIRLEGKYQVFRVRLQLKPGRDINQQQHCFRGASAHFSAHFHLLCVSLAFSVGFLVQLSKNLKQWIWDIVDLSVSWKMLTCHLLLLFLQSSDKVQSETQDAIICLGRRRERKHSRSWGQGDRMEGTHCWVAPVWYCYPV